MVDRLLEPINEDFKYNKDRLDLLERSGLTVFVKNFFTKIKMKIKFALVIIPYMILTGA